jgi:tetratricopeptide (TPR) repeat protein
VELELGLFDEAAEKFTRVLERDDKSVHAIAAYGQGVALLSIAQRLAQDGKAGAAFAHVQVAIDSCLSLTMDYLCTRKLLGDLYSFGASLPPDVFSGEGPVSMIHAQLDFTSKGEDAYRSAVNLQVARDEEELKLLRASIMCDIGANILLQAQLLSLVNSVDFTSCAEHGAPEVTECYDRSMKEFQAAIASSPLYAPAWCGLGCAVAASDPLLAQHAFCRCIELDKMFHDAYANIGFFYTAWSQFPASESVMDSLTQVSDSPMMWINRAFMLERGAADALENDRSQSEKNICRAADAYRAALQVMKHPIAMLGLALTCRMNEVPRNMSGRLSRKESYSHMVEYIGSTGSKNQAASILGGVMTLEEAKCTEADWNSSLNAKGQAIIEKGLGSEGVSDGLDFDVILDCLAADQEEGKEETSTPQPFEMSLARQIVHEPNRADLWLAMAKELLASTNPSTPSLASAEIAADRASSMLLQQLTHPPRAGGSGPFAVEAPIISEALALGYWIREIVDDKQKEEADEKEEQEASKSRSRFDLQRSLIMCPNNPLAREALKLSSSN